MRSLAFFIAMSASLFSACSGGEIGLDNVHDDIVSDHAIVDQISPDAFSKLERENLLILDIREPEEYAVSRIPGAIWVSPNGAPLFSQNACRKTCWQMVRRPCLI